MTKNLYKWVALAMSAVMMSVCLAACDDDDEVASGNDSGDEEDVVTEISSVAVSPNSISESAEGGITTVKVTSNTSWSVSVPSDDSWVSVSVASGTGDADVIINVAENESESSRSTTVTIATDDTEASCTISIAQLSAGEVSASIVVSPEEITIDAEGGSETVTVTADVAWTAEVYVSQGSSDWVALSTTAGDAGETAVTVTASENADTDERSIDYIFRAADGSDVVGHLTITQEAAASSDSGVTVEHQTLRIEIPAAGTSITDGEADLEYIVYVYGSSEVPVLACDNDAFKFEFIQSVAAGYKPGTDHVFGVVAAENTTDQVISGTLTVTVGDSYTATVKVVQANASGSYAAEGSQEVYLPLTSLTGIFGSSTITLDGTSWTLYTDDSSNELFASFTSGSTWFLGQFAGYRLQFTSGATFAIYGSDEVTFTKIELLDTDVTTHFASGQFTSDIGTMTVGDDLDIEVTPGGDKATYKCMEWEGSAQRVNFTVNADETYLRAFRLTYTIGE